MTSSLQQWDAQPPQLEQFVIDQEYDQFLPQPFGPDHPQPSSHSITPRYQPQPNTAPSYSTFPGADTQHDHQPAYGAQNAWSLPPDHAFALSQPPQPALNQQQYGQQQQQHRPPPPSAFAPTSPPYWANAQPPPMPGARRPGVSPAPAPGPQITSDPAAAFVTSPTSIDGASGAYNAPGTFGYGGGGGAPPNTAYRQPQQHYPPSASAGPGPETSAARSSSHYRSPADARPARPPQPQLQMPASGGGTGLKRQRTNTVVDPSSSSAAARAAAYREPADASHASDNEDDGEGELERDAGRVTLQPRESLRERGACSRCKMLKVKCVRDPDLSISKGLDPDVCRRCMNGGHECVVPGKRPRKQPPKRGDLMQRIQAQAAHIERLMKQLEAATLAANDKHQGAHRPQNVSVPTPSLSVSAPYLMSPLSNASHSGISADSRSPEAERGDPLDDRDLGRYSLGQPPPPSTAPDPRVQDWIAKARASFEQFGGYIGMGGARGGGVTRALVADEDPEDEESSDEYADYDVLDEESELDIAVESDGESAVVDAGSPYGVMSVGPSRSRRASNNPSEDGSGGGARREPAAGTKQKLASLPTEAVPFGLMADMSLKMKAGKQRPGKKGSGTESVPGSPENTTGTAEASGAGQGDASGDVAEEHHEERVGIADEDYFRPSPEPETRGPSIVDPSHQAPHILAKGIVTPDEVEKLFRIYFDYMNCSLSILDPVLYTAKTTYWRSPFLFTVICAVASRYYGLRPELYGELMNYARLAAGTALIGGPKTVENVFAYILLALYPLPVKKWEDDRTWLYLGLAIRIATDLNLHHPSTAKPRNESHARELLNRTRAWINCFNLDRSTGSQYGKSPIIPNHDYVANHSEEWWHSSEYNLRNFDIHLSGYNAELRCLSQFRAKVYSDPNHPTLLNKDADIGKLAMDTDDKLQNLWKVWTDRLKTVDAGDAQGQFRSGIMSLAYSYARLAALSVGFQHAFGKRGSNPHEFLQRCWRAASDVVTDFANNLGTATNRIFLRHGPEAQSVFVTFACAFLVKLLHPKYANYMTVEQRQGIRPKVQRIAELLGSPDVAIDDRHAPKLYSHFLENLLATPLARADPTLLHKRSSAARRNAPKQRTVSPATSPTVEYASYFDAPHSRSAPNSHYPSPTEQRTSVSPPPAATTFGQLPTSPTSSAFLNPHGLGLGLNQDHPTLFNPPLAFDDELMQTMQTAVDQTFWPGVWPGFGWMGQFNHQNDSDVLMGSVDPRMIGTFSSS
ncbi:hypothetical protein PUNSTDRAFT_146153 [Punctularia strigosozonata HHB-11173 SS5]|uniref:Xylanolytic transcriptional activator regulatory domain-containing protein n=1 Tax=Punctularia strigosozonata (strain HHB-11173) TaxID=741275 RepID=R7S354_PUNST|nr:uncharacterized protein PUNSTDRAFT_146153 [Punctularia strigosozonata HHB-11173 SS5]EIN04820.1 hypothetical protein PUNSTDRAFT_146153 [Punctularia strigosozonata HHB-11173 SS5]